MKTLYAMFAVIIAVFIMASCKKDKPTDINPPPVTPVVQGNVLSGLGTTPGYPLGAFFELPDNISIIGDIRGGIYGKAPVDKTFKGPFNQSYKANWTSYGTGTYVNLYIQFYNSLNSPTTFTMPGGLIFVDSSDLHEHIGVYQKGFILQDVEVQINALDTAFVVLRAYCLNHTLAPSSYAAVYYIGPITYNPQLNQITAIMTNKQYPFGEEYNIQTIIWNVTDYALTLTPAEIAYLNALP